MQPVGVLLFCSHPSVTMQGPRAVSWGAYIRNENPGGAHESRQEQFGASDIFSYHYCCKPLLSYVECPAVFPVPVTILCTLAYFCSVCVDIVGLAGWFV